MTKDRNGRVIHAGDVVHLIPGMRVGRQFKATVSRINGEYIYCVMWGPGYIGEVERYGCEMTIVSSIWSD